MNDVHVVVPAWIDDPQRPSGGNVYDRRICDGLAALGWSVHEHPVAGTWPRIDPAEDPSVAVALARLPAGTLVLVDGLVAAAVARPAASGRLRVVVLQHMVAAVPSEPAALAPSAFVATSDATRRWLIADCGVAADRVHVVQPGVDPAPLASGSGSGTRLLSVGALTPVKGQDLLVEAVAGLEGQSCRCVLVGSAEVDPAFVADLRCRIGKLGLGDRISLPGALSRTALDAAYAEADLLVLPSRAESFGMVVTEALARGIPVVAADVGGVREALGRTPDGRLPGVLVPAQDRQALAQAIATWLADQGERERLRSAARARRQTLLDWSDAARTMAAALTTIAGRDM